MFSFGLTVFAALVLIQVLEKFIIEDQIEKSWHSNKAKYNEGFR